MTASERGSKARLAALVAGLVFACGMHAAAARPLDQVTASGFVDISVYKDFAPYAYEENGELKGLDVEIGRALAAEMKLEPRFMVRMAGETVDDDLRSNVWRGDIVEKVRADVMMHVPVDKELAHRNELVMICCGYYLETVALVVDPREVTVESLAVFRSKKVAVELDSVADFFLSGAYKGQLMHNVVRGRVFMDAARLYWSGETAAFMGPRAQAEWIASKTERPSKLSEPPLHGLYRSKWPIGLAVRTDSRDLGYALEEAMERLKESGRLAAIFQRYGVTYVAPPVE